MSNRLARPVMFHLKLILKNEATKLAELLLEYFLSGTYWKYLYYITGNWMFDKNLVFIKIRLKKSRYPPQHLSVLNHLREKWMLGIIRFDNWSLIFGPGSYETSSVGLCHQVCWFAQCIYALLLDYSSTYCLHYPYPFIILVKSTGNAWCYLKVESFAGRNFRHFVNSLVVHEN